MKTLTLTLAAALIALPAYAGNLDAIVAPEPAEEEAAPMGGSSAAWIVPLLAILVIAAASSDSDDSTPPPAQNGNGLDINGNLVLTD